MISTCILINDCILQDFEPPVDVSTEDVKRVREMLCEYILKRPSTDRASSTVVHREFIVTRNLKLLVLH
jgi:predicted metal-binding transcription factor (methanogenesis marker protein 9)